MEAMNLFGSAEYFDPCIAHFPSYPQSLEVCLKAVRHSGANLEYVKEEFKTPEVCIAAVKQTGYALEYVKEQTPEICMAAVQTDGRALEYKSVKNNLYHITYLLSQLSREILHFSHQPTTPITVFLSLLKIGKESRY